MPSCLREGFVEPIHDECRHQAHVRRDDVRIHTFRCACQDQLFSEICCLRERFPPLFSTGWGGVKLFFTHHDEQWTLDASRVKLIPPQCLDDLCECVDAPAPQYAFSRISDDPRRRCLTSRRVVQDFPFLASLSMAWFCVVYA